MMFLIIIEAVTAADNIMITQILYDPMNSEAGGEAVELFNPTSSAIDISGWLLATETSSTDATLPANTIVGSGNYFLVTDAGWSVSKDDVSWPESDYEEIMTLTNTDAGIALINGTNTIDSVGWGTALNIGAGLYEGIPHGGSSAGESLVRVKNGSIYVDTNNNLNDFTAATPNFHNSSFGNAGQSNSEIIVMAMVEGSFPVINSFTILTDDDSNSAGIQINPVPKQNKTVEMETVVTHYSGNDYVSSVAITVDGINFDMVKQSELNSTSSLYNAEFNMSYYDSAGNYAVDLIVTDNGNFSVNSSKSFEYSSLIAMELDTNSLQFSAMPGMSSELIGDNDLANTNLTIQNTGNSALDMELSGTNLTTSNDVIEVSNIQYTFNGDYNNSLAGTLSYSKQAKQLGMDAASVMPLSFKLNVPTATAPGNYTGTITLIAVKS